MHEILSHKMPDLQDFNMYNNVFAEKKQYKIQMTEHTEKQNYQLQFNLFV